MANKFEVRVVALDQFTKTFRDLNNQASKAVRPLVNVHRQVGMLAREMHLDKMAKGMGVVSDQALTMTRALGLSLGPLQNVLGAVGGAGIVGMLGAAAVGAVKLGVNFASAGFEVSRASQAMGVSTRFLQRMRGAAKLTNIEVGTVDDTIRGLGDTLQNAQFGRDPTAYAILNRLGIGIPMKNGHVDTELALEGVERALSKIQDAQTRNTLADALHIPRESIALLMQGAEAVQDLGDRAERAGLVQGPAVLKWSVDFTNSLNRMQGAIQGAANALGADLVPPMTKLLDKTSEVTEKGGLGKGAMTLYGGGLKGIPNLGPFAFLARLQGSIFQSFGAIHGTTPNERQVSGAIGGALHNGPIDPSDLRRAAGSASTNVGDPRSWGGVPLRFPDTTVADAVGGFGPSGRIDPAVQAARDSDAMMILRDELGRSTDPADRAAIQREIDRRTAAGGTSDSIAATDRASRVAIDLHVHGLPAGATVTAQQRSAGADAFTPTRIGYSMATAEMP
jgi:hypothetical protein